VFADDPPGACPVCHGPTRVEKTFRHGGLTLEHGAFEARESVRVCLAGCRREDGKQRVRLRQPAFATRLLPRSTVGYDVMTFVGLQRFVHHRQREEIRTELQVRHGIRLSTGEISTLGRRFLVYLEALHEAKAALLRAALAQDGGWPLHIDATGEDGRGTLLVAYTGWRHWTLGAWKIPTERADAIRPRLFGLVGRFGAPCAIVRDLGRAVREASHDLVVGLGTPTPILACHLHFLRDVGKDLLIEAHDTLRGLFRRFNVRHNLRTLARDLGRGLGTDIEKAREGVTEWLAGAEEGHTLPGDTAGLAASRALAQWVLDYPHDGNDEGFPFDLPYLDLYRRCRTACRAVEAFLWAPSGDPKVHRVLKRLHRVLDPVKSQLPFQRPAAILEARAQLFTELREALRLKAKRPRDPTGAAEDEKTLCDVKAAVETLQASLGERRPERGPAQNTRQAIDLILAHLQTHGPFLWGHAIALPVSAGGGVRLVDRTNNQLEGFFKTLKHGERRRSGREILTHDLEQLPAAAALAFNLTRSDYVTLVCGSLDKLPQSFAELDALDRRRSLPARLAAVSDDHGSADVASSSMPTIDRRLVREDALVVRLRAAARSRAPTEGARPLRYGVAIRRPIRRSATVV
jgi:hypothetical protein